MAPMLLGKLAILLLVLHVNAVPETNHLVEIDSDGHKISMDVTYDPDKNTVLVIVGDISQYKDSRLTVNLHDFNTGYGVLKDVNRQTCLLGKAFTPRAMPEKYRMGVTTEIHEHLLQVSPETMTKEEIYDLAGPNIAAFCNDYDTYFVEGTPLTTNRQRVAAASVKDTYSDWCVVSRCLVQGGPNVLQKK